MVVPPVRLITSHTSVFLDFSIFVVGSLNLFPLMYRCVGLLVALCVVIHHDVPRHHRLPLVHYQIVLIKLDGILGSFIVFFDDRMNFITLLLRVLVGVLLGYEYGALLVNKIVEVFDLEKSMTTS